MNTYDWVKPKTVEAKLDCILDRCKRNMSSTDNLKSEWIEICKAVAENNTDTNCPLFKTYIRHLEKVDNLIYLDYDGQDEIYRATATGLMYKGYVNEKNTNEAAEKIKNSREILLMRGAVGAAIGGIALAAIEILKLALEYHWWPFCAK